MARINCIMLIDDNQDDNYLHERVIKKSGLVGTIIVKESAIDALEYLKSRKEHPDAHPDLIFLDINMPKMNGWEFLDAYTKLEKEFQVAAVVTMLTVSIDPVDKAKALAHNLSVDFMTKPLTAELFGEVLAKYFSGTLTGNPDEKGKSQS